ncbi:hypothetical protein L873DRAFT_1799463, partial [Choiromyces venosus 120613-1]
MKKPYISLIEINKDIIPDHPLSTATLKRHFKGKDMCKWLAATHSELEEEDAVRQLAWAQEHEHLTVQNWL